MSPVVILTLLLALSGVWSSSEEQDKEARASKRFLGSSDSQVLLSGLEERCC